LSEPTTDHDDDTPDEVVAIATAVNQWLLTRYPGVSTDKVVAALTYEATLLIATSAPSEDAIDRLFFIMRNTVRKLRLPRPVM